MVANKARKKSPEKARRESWKDLDYWLWCVMTGDDEQTRLYDSPDQVLTDLIKAGANLAVAAKAQALIKAMQKGDWSAMEKLEKLFKPYASHQKLFNEKGEWYNRYNHKLEYG